MLDLGFHICILVFSRPQNLPLPNSSDTSYHDHKPHDDHQNCQNAGNPIYSRTVVARAQLNDRKCETAIRKDECPPIQREAHPSYPGNDRHRRNAEEPEPEEQGEPASYGSKDLHYLAVLKTFLGTENICR